jgi:hypothetical protein
MRNGSDGLGRGMTIRGRPRASWSQARSWDGSTSILNVDGCGPARSTSATTSSRHIVGRAMQPVRWSCSFAISTSRPRSIRRRCSFTPTTLPRCLSLPGRGSRRAATSTGVGTTHARSPAINCRSALDETAPLGHRGDVEVRCSFCRRIVDSHHGIAGETATTAFTCWDCVDLANEARSGQGEGQSATP